LSDGVVWCGGGKGDGEIEACGSRESQRMVVVEEEEEEE
jgi:hypothetical protein